MVKAAKLYCLGIPLDKAQRLLFSSQSRLGNDTLGNNLHDWALNTCKPLLDSLTNFPGRTTYDVDGRDDVLGAAKQGARDLRGA